MPWTMSLPALPASFTITHLFLAVASGAALALTYTHLRSSSDYHFRSRLPSVWLTDEAAALISSLSNKKSKPDPSTSNDLGHVPPTGSGLQSAIGNTPLILLPHLSALTGSQIYAKLELLNPGGSPKDRVALSILTTLSTPSPSNPSGPVLQPGDTIYEGTVGSTGISLATLCRSRGLLAHIVMPSDQSREKGELLLKLGAKVTKVEPAPIVDERHFINVARRLARVQTEEFERGVEVEDEVDEIEGDGLKERRRKPKWSGRGWFADQFENEANWRAHYMTTGPEIYSQMEGDIDAFVAGAGTGGTITGVGMYLKEKTRTGRHGHIQGSCNIILADPQGSGLYNKVKHGVFYSAYEREGTRRRSQVDTVIEGIGLTRATRNWVVGEEWEEGMGVVDDAVKVSDQMARNMARWLGEREGVWVGGSSAVNCVAALKTALDLGPGHRIVTILCDSGARHMSKFWAQIGEIGGEAKVTLEDILEGREVK